MANMTGRRGDAEDEEGTQTGRGAKSYQESGDLHRSPVWSGGRN